MRNRLESVPREASQLLARFFPGFNLDRITVCVGIPWYVIGGPVGYADRNTIYLAPGACRLDSVEGLALLAHEIAHCRQYCRYGTWRFRALYLASYFNNRLRGMSSREAYWNIPFEIEAREIEAEVYFALQGLQFDPVIDFLLKTD